MSRTWFETAAESDTLDASKQKRAECFAKIAGYYSNLDSQDKAGDSEFSYKTYWEDLVELTDGDLTTVDNERTALVMYNELVYQVYTNTVKFQRDGVLESELQGQLDKVQERLNDGFFSDDVREDKEKLLSDIETAKRQIIAAYSGQITVTGGEDNAGS